MWIEAPTLCGDPDPTLRKEGVSMNCLCNLFDNNNCVWIIIIALLLICNNNGCGCH